MANQKYWSFGGYASTKTKNHYYDRKGRLFSFGDQITQKPNWPNCYWIEMLYSDPYIPNSKMNIDHSFFRFLIEKGLQKDKGSLVEMYKTQEIVRIAIKQKAKKIKQMHNEYKPGGLGWFITKTRFERKQGIQKQTLIKRRTHYP